MALVQTEHYSEALAAGPTQAELDKLYQDDAVWIITSSFIIFTMHSGFGLLESGSVSAKDEVNIMVKNVVDVVFGGLSYWAFGYGFSYGDSIWPVGTFIGLSKFFYDPTGDDSKKNREGWNYAAFLFQLSFATTASTIVSGAVAERCKLKSYIILGCLVILIQALPARWIWDPQGFFTQLGVIDFAGCSAVHMVGGVIGLIATLYLRPRRGRFSEDGVHQMSSPTNALLGTFMLWWGWFGINAGSAWGITDQRWRFGARAAVATIMSSIGGGATAIIISFVRTRKLQVNYLIFGLLASIVSITALCAIARPWHALLVGSVGSALAIGVLPVLERLHVDDPVGIVPIHVTSSIWGMIAVGIFCEEDRLGSGNLSVTSRRNGLLYSGGFTLLGIQMLCSLTIVIYSSVMGLFMLMVVNYSPFGLRVTDYEEQLGADVVEHGLAGTNIARYVIEKPLSTRTFKTVTKAITKWKLQTKMNARLRRQQQMLERQRQRTAIRLDLENTKFGMQNGDLESGVGNGGLPKHAKPSQHSQPTGGAARSKSNKVGPDPGGGEREMSPSIRHSMHDDFPSSARSAHKNDTTVTIHPRPSSSDATLNNRSEKMKETAIEMKETKMSPLEQSSHTEAVPTRSANSPTMPAIDEEEAAKKLETKSPEARPSTIASGGSSRRSRSRTKEARSRAATAASISRIRAVIVPPTDDSFFDDSIFSSLGQNTNVPTNSGDGTN